MIVLLKLASLFSDFYSEYFGFTEEEVFTSMDEYGCTKKYEVKKWYDGFKIGEASDIYNPWAIIEFLKSGKLETYCINTSKKSLVSEFISCGSGCLKEDFSELMNGKTMMRSGVFCIQVEILRQLILMRMNTNWILLIMKCFSISVK